MKVEVSENDNQFPFQGSQKRNDNVEKSQAQPTDKPKSQRQIQDSVKPVPAHQLKSDSPAEKATTSKDERVKKRRKMMKQLEDLNLQRQINKLEQEVWELDQE